MKQQYWIDDEGGLFMNDEQTMKDLVANGYIKSFKAIKEQEFKTLLIRNGD